VGISGARREQCRYYCFTTFGATIDLLARAITSGPDKVATKEVCIRFGKYYKPHNTYARQSQLSESTAQRMGSGGNRVGTASPPITRIAPLGVAGCTVMWNYCLAQFASGWGR